MCSLINLDWHKSMESTLFYLYIEPRVIFQLRFYVDFGMWGIHKLIQILMLFPLKSVFCFFRRSQQQFMYGILIRSIYLILITR